LAVLSLPALLVEPRERWRRGEPVPGKAFSEFQAEQDDVWVLHTETWHERRRRLDELGGSPLP
jgi:hypothetical protein